MMATLGGDSFDKPFLFFLRRSMVVPLYFIGTGGLFFVLLRYLNVSVHEAQRSGWLFSFNVGGDGTDNVAEGLDLLEMLQLINFKHIRWDLVGNQLFTILGIVFFSVIHVPVNTPALAASCHMEPDLDKELRVRFNLKCLAENS